MQEFVHQSKQKRIRISPDAFLPFPRLIAISEKYVKDLICTFFQSIIFKLNSAQTRISEDHSMGNLQRLPVLIRDEAGLNQDAVEQAEHDRENCDADAKEFCRNHS